MQPGSDRVSSHERDCRSRLERLENVKLNRHQGPPPREDGAALLAARRPLPQAPARITPIAAMMTVAALD